jgi:hypothetical protein
VIVLGNFSILILCSVYGEYHTSSQGTDISGHFTSRFRGGGEGYFEFSTHANPGKSDNALDSEFDFHFSGSGWGHGDGRIRGVSASDIPLVWLFNQTLSYVKEKGSAPFAFWVGKVNYTKKLSEVNASQKKIADTLASSTQLTFAELQQIGLLLASKTPTLSEAEYTSALSPLLQRLELFKQPQSPTSEFNLKFDDSVSSERILEFLVALGKAFNEAGGCVCIASTREDV